MIKAKYKTIKPESSLKLRQSLSEDWNKYKTALEKEYAAGHHRG